MAGTIICRLVFRALSTLTLGVATSANAQGLTDPTQPPPELRGQGNNGNALPVPGAGQIIVLSRIRKEVTVNGQTAKLGGRLGEATVVDITDSHVTTRDGALVEQIRLYGDADKRVAPPQRGVKP